MIMKCKPYDMTITRYFEDHVNPMNYFFFFFHAMNYIKSHVKYFYFYNSIVEGRKILTLDIKVRKYKNVLVELQGSWLSHVKYGIKLNYQQI